MVVPSRRAFLAISGAALSGAGVALLAGKDALAAAADKSAIRPTTSRPQSALAADSSAIAAYGVGAGSGLLTGPVLALATTFQGHHKPARGRAAGAVHPARRKPATAKPSYHFAVETLKTQNDVLRLLRILRKAP